MDSIIIERFQWNRVRRPRPVLPKPSETSQPVITEPKPQLSSDGMPSNGYITRITNDDREQEMDDNLQLVASHLVGLKNMALDMNDTIQYQNTQLERINVKTESSNDRVTFANKQARDVLRKA